MKKPADGDYYRFIFENSLDAIMLTSPDGHIYRANRAAEKMFQRSEAELCELGRACVVDLNDPRLEAALHKRETDGFVRAEINYVRKDGSIFPGDVTSAVFIDENGDSWSAMIIRDVSAYKEIEESLRQANAETVFFAMNDFLTGVLNRRVFLEKLLLELVRAKRNSNALSILMIDVDHFKKINDTLGHFAGDSVLKSIADAIQAVLRPYDLFGRFGGDEFIICLPDTDSETADNVAERIRSKIENLETPHDNERIKTTISIGVANYKGVGTETENELIARADKNLYRAKMQKNCVVSENKSVHLEGV